MLIVSQDKKRFWNSEKFEEVRILKTRFGEITIRAEGYNDHELGIYETEERAKEVLTEILERIYNWENLKVGQPSGVCDYIYNMPKE